MGRDAAAATTVARVSSGSDPAGSVLTAPPPAAVTALMKPLLRGWSHAVAFIVVLTLGGVLIGASVGTRRGPAVMIVYVAGTGTMFGVSAAYHRLRWSLAARRLMSKLDHCTIFFAIAGAYTPVAVVALDGWHRISVLVTVWGGSVVGIALEWVPYHLPRWAFAAVYVIVGWAAAPSFGQLYNGLGIAGFLLILGGGLAYTVGALVYGMKRPDPWPTVFGYHEVFHACTVVGAGLHFAVMAFVLLPKL